MPTLVCCLQTKVSLENPKDLYRQVIHLPLITLQKLFLFSEWAVIQCYGPLSLSDTAHDTQHTFVLFTILIPFSYSDSPLLRSRGIAHRRSTRHEHAFGKWPMRKTHPYNALVESY